MDKDIIPVLFLRYLFSAPQSYPESTSIFGVFGVQTQAVDFLDIIHKKSTSYKLYELEI